MIRSDGRRGTVFFLFLCLPPVSGMLVGAEGCSRFELLQCVSYVAVRGSNPVQVGRAVTIIERVSDGKSGFKSYS